MEARKYLCLKGSKPSGVVRRRELVSAMRAPELAPADSFLPGLPDSDGCDREVELARSLARSLRMGRMGAAVMAPLELDGHVDHGAREVFPL